MCGVAGAIGVINPAVKAAVQRMSFAQKHRGPDDNGYWQSQAEPTFSGACFAFRRLAIIDLSVDGHQPMVDHESGHVIEFNGEIYNFQELRQELEELGVRFRSKSDTEVLLKGYRQWGLEVLRRLRGMYAFAIWDAVQRRVIIARDRLGIKPLYVCNIDQPGDQSTLLFASELRSLLDSGLIQRRLNPDALQSFLWNGFVVGPDTMIEGVRLLPAGCVAIVDPANGRCELQRYWQLPKESSEIRGIDRLREELRTSIQQHLLSDVPLGVFLSGGVDSSAMTALAVDVVGAGEGVQTFNISFDEAKFDESQHARAVADALGTRHHDIRVTERHFKDHLSDALHSLDQPTFDAINTYFVSRAVREAGITVALAGTGGDEIFGGYRSFIDVPKAARTAARLSRTPERLLRAAAGGFARVKLGRFGETPPQTRWGKLGDILATRGRLVDVYQVSYGLFTQEVHAALLGDHEASLRYGLPRGRAHELSAMIADASPLHAMSTLELSNYIGERLLRDTDTASMAVSLEVRVPLLDHVVVEAAAAVNAADRFHPLGRKLLLRRLAMPNLDPALFDRPKSGFVLPIEAWCRQMLKAEVAAMLADRDLCASVGLDHEAVGRLWRSFEAGAPGMYWSRVWAIFVLLWWCREHRVSL